MDYSEKELLLIEKLSKDWYNLIKDKKVNFSPIRVYASLARDSFVANTSGPEIESLRRICYVLDNSVVNRNTPEFDALIDLENENLNTIINIRKDDNLIFVNTQSNYYTFSEKHPVFIQRKNNLNMPTADMLKIGDIIKQPNANAIICISKDEDKNVVFVETQSNRYTFNKNHLIFIERENNTSISLADNLKIGDIIKQTDEKMFKTEDLVIYRSI